MDTSASFAKMSQLLLETVIFKILINFMLFKDFLGHFQSYRNLRWSGNPDSLFDLKPERTLVNQMPSEYAELMAII